MNKKLFAFDMDGTLLIDSKNSIVSDSVKKTIKKLIKDGHVVCLFTGRPWRASKKVYEELELDTIIVNYNGAYIHHPKKYDFMPIIEKIPMANVMKIVASKELKKIAKNIVVEGPQYIHIDKREKSHFTESFIQVQDKNIINSPISFHSMNSNPTGVLVEIKKQYANSMDKVTSFLKSKYGDMVAVSYWETGKGNLPILELTNFKAKKDIALVRVARHYGIDMSDTIAFGDAHNDVRMLKMAGVGVAMSNANDNVKSHANVVSKYTNKDNGVAKFVKWYFAKGSKKVDSTIYTLGSDNAITQVIEGE